MYCKIESTEAQTISFQITNELGQTITSFNVSAYQGITDEQIPTENLESGVYILAVEFSNGSAPVHKSFIISKL